MRIDQIPPATKCLMAVIFMLALFMETVSRRWA
jgi:hypothetical protein